VARFGAQRFGHQDTVLSHQAGQIQPDSS
jgi:hypothetical protein